MPVNQLFIKKACPVYLLFVYLYICLEGELECYCGGIGRPAGLKIPFAVKQVPVRPRPVVPTYEKTDLYRRDGHFGSLLK